MKTHEKNFFVHYFLLSVDEIAVQLTQKLIRFTIAGSITEMEKKRKILVYRLVKECSNLILFFI